MSALVTFAAVSKRYRRGRERMNLRAALPGSFGQTRRGDFHWALSDVTFELDAGNSLGLIGPNGAGKSTTLKLVAGVIAPTTGSIAVRGRTASLIELGAGFHPDMTGRENLYFSAAVLGMGPKTIRKRFDQIAEFADIGAYLDTPVKRYSSGMLARLGFAVASHLDAEVLVLDEVLAVGDAAFQRKCHRRIADLTKQGVALLYVTHAIWTVPMLCKEAILLVGGSIQSQGAPVDVVQDYEKLHQSGAIPITDGSIKVIRRLNAAHRIIQPAGNLSLAIEIELPEPHPDGVALVFLADEQLKVYATVSSRDAGISFDRSGSHRMTCHLESMPLQPGSYNVYCAFAGNYQIPAIDDVQGITIEVSGDPVDPAGGMIRIPAHWSQ